jgi:predicted nucleic acid-binding protein
MKTVTAPIGFERIVVDSSGWIEYLGEGPNADRFALYLQSQTSQLLLPSLVVYEVHKKIYKEKGLSAANQFVSQAFSFAERLIPLTLELSISASVISADAHLAMADAVIYATAEHHRAQLITSDAHFANLPGVTMI